MLWLINIKHKTRFLTFAYYANNFVLVHYITETSNCSTVTHTHTTAKKTTTKTRYQPFLASQLVHPYHVDKFVSSFSGFSLIVFSFIDICMQTVQSLVTSGQMPHSAASELSLHSLYMSPKWVSNQIHFFDVVFKCLYFSIHLKYFVEIKSKQKDFAQITLEFPD